MDWEFGVSRCKLLHVELISIEVLLHSRGRYIQSTVMCRDGKEYIKKYFQVHPVILEMKTRGHISTSRKTEKLMFPYSFQEV